MRYTLFRFAKNVTKYFFVMMPAVCIFELRHKALWYKGMECKGLGVDKKFIDKVQQQAGIRDRDLQIQKAHKRSIAKTLLNLDYVFLFTVRYELEDE